MTDLDNEALGLPDTSEQVRATSAVLIELAELFGEYRDSLVVSGGLAMHLLFGARTTAGDGSHGQLAPFARYTKDVDFVLNLVSIDHSFDDRRETIGELLDRSLYQRKGQFWVRSVRLTGFTRTYEVPVEFLAPTEYDTELDGSLVHQIAVLQDVRPAALDGIALALLQPRLVPIRGTTPDGRFLRDISVQVVDPAMLILIKAIAFSDRLRKHEYRSNPDDGTHLEHAAKHAYDISQLLHRYPGGVSALTDRLVPPYLGSTVGPKEQATIDRALEALRAHFTDRDARGIRLMISEGEHRYEDGEDAARAQQGTVGRVQRLLKRLDECAESLY